MILDKINNSQDIKKLSIDEMKKLSAEMRELIIKKVDAIGGHMAPNLGIVEATIALHYVFDFPKDKIVFDVSHQCYPHKIITNRKNGFLNPENYLTHSGYTAPEESEYDLFKVGHTSTSISLASGLRKARDLKKENYNVIALIGDGSLTGGEALEGLDFASSFKSNFIVLLNDNDMSIAENHGGLYSHLKQLRDSKGKMELNFFKTLGYDYIFIEDGNDIEELIEKFKQIKNSTNPIVVHMVTKKGKGLQVAEENKEFFHWVMPHSLSQKEKTNVEEENYTNLTTKYFLKKAQEDKDFLVVNAGTPGVFGLSKDIREKLNEHYIDVGIKEEHAIAYCSGVAKNGSKPVFCVMSSFIQRGYDQLSQDLCLNNSPATILVYWGGINGGDATHLCTFDIPLISNIPNLAYLAPTNKEEYEKMLDWSVNQKDYPVAIRVPNIKLISTNEVDNTDYSILNKYKVNENGEKIAIIGLGNFYYLGKEIKEYIKEKLNINSTLINPIFITGLDIELLNNLKSSHNIVITLEDGEINGGFGEKIASFYGNSNMKVLNYGSHKEFTDRISLDESYKKYHLTKEQILDDIKPLL